MNLEEILHSEMKSKFLLFFGKKTSPQVWSALTRFDNLGYKTTKEKLKSIKRSTDRYESSAAMQALKMMSLYENHLKNNNPDEYTRLQ